MNYEYMWNRLQKSIIACSKPVYTKKDVLRMIERLEMHEEAKTQDKIRSMR